MVNCVALGMVLAVMVTFLFCGPFFLPESKVTSISAEAPGGIGSLGHVGTVQPQEPLAVSITSGSLPVLVNVKLVLFFVFSATLPKSCSMRSNFMVVGGYFDAFSAGFSAALGSGVMPGALAVGLAVVAT